MESATFTAPFPCRTLDLRVEVPQTQPPCAGVSFRALQGGQTLQANEVASGWVYRRTDAEGVGLFRHALPQGAAIRFEWEAKPREQRWSTSRPAPDAVRARVALELQAEDGTPWVWWFDGERESLQRLTPP